MPWIGLHNLEREGEYTWIDGAQADNLDWNDDEPNNLSLRGVRGSVLRDEDCGNLYQGKLSDEHCAFEFPGLNEKKVD